MINRVQFDWFIDELSNFVPKGMPNFKNTKVYNAWLKELQKWEVDDLQAIIDDAKLNLQSFPSLSAMHKVQKEYQERKARGTGPVVFHYTPEELKQEAELREVRAMSWEEYWDYCEDQGRRVKADENGFITWRDVPHAKRMHIHPETGAKLTMQEGQDLCDQWQQAWLDKYGFKVRKGVRININDYLGSEENGV